ncbi:MAG: DHH family phosphoesterase [Patescibacteria group bacterium]|jgi:inorganic pyrophosphatase/exopolyphosphatase
MLSNEKGTIVVTTGEEWTDIDAFASAVAYTELLNLRGNHAVTVIPGPTNATVPKHYRALATIETQAPETYSDVVIVDLSNPEYFAKFAQTDNVKEIFDHHTGFEKFWREKLGESAHIEMIGACATLIWEEIERAGMIDRISKNTAKLIAAAIASNTLNFQIAITSPRDISAFKTSARISGFDEATQADYFTACESEIVKDVSKALHYDTKLIHTSTITTPIAIGQIELWHSEPIVRSNTKEIQTELSQHSSSWLLNAPSIGDGYTILYCINENLRQMIADVIPVTWTGDFGKTERIMLRKEIVKALQTHFV